MKRILFIILIVINAVACEMENRLESIHLISELEMYVGEKIGLNVSHSPVDALVPAYHYNTSNRYVAAVNGKGVVVGNRVGTCTIMIATADTRFSTSCVIKVKPKNELYCEPTLDFNITRAAVKLKESSRVIIHETETMLVYQGFEDPLVQVAYQFDENQKLTASVAKLAANVSSDLTDFLNERYDIFPSAENGNLLIWRGNGMEIVTRRMNNACFVVYHPFSGKSTVENAIQTIEIIRNHCK